MAARQLATAVAKSPSRQHGILSAVWYSRNQFWGETVAALYRGVPILRESRKALLPLVILGLTIGLLRSMVIVWATVNSNRTGMQVTTRLRESLHRQTMRLGPSDLEDKRSSEGFELFTKDADTIRTGVSQYVRHLTRSPLELGLLMLFAIALNWRVSLQCMIPLGFCWFLIQRERRRFAETRQAIEVSAAGDLNHLAEGLHKSRLIRGYGMRNSSSSSSTGTSTDSKHRQKP